MKYYIYESNRDYGVMVCTPATRPTGIKEIATIVASDPRGAVVRWLEQQGKRAKYVSAEETRLGVWLVDYDLLDNK